MTIKKELNCPEWGRWHFQWKILNLHTLQTLQFNLALSFHSHPPSHSNTAKALFARFFDAPPHAVIYKTNIKWTEWASRKETHQHIHTILQLCHIHIFTILLYICNFTAMHLHYNLQRSVAVAVACCQSMYAYFVMVASEHCKPTRMGQYTVFCLNRKVKRNWPSTTIIPLPFLHVFINYSFLAS